MNYELFKFWLDVLVSLLLPIVSYIVGVTLSKISKINDTLQDQTESIFGKISELEERIDARDQRMRDEINARFTEERQLVYRLLDAIKKDG
jgi:membrane protein implicated in regulation of membrane protease activity